MKAFDKIGRRLTGLADDFASKSYSPYSGRRVACIALLSDGTWVPGVRVENASFPLLVSAALNAITTAVAEGRSDFVAFGLNRPMTHVERDLLEAFMDPVTISDGLATCGDDIPSVGECLDASHSDPPANHDSGIHLARTAAKNAHVPESDFPVGCILTSASGRYVKGVNVEHPDWNLGLCAERNAICTAVTFGLTDLSSMYLTCIKDPKGTPCGACRQVLIEHAHDLQLVMDRGAETQEATTPSNLLPHSFGGQSLRA